MNVFIFLVLLIGPLVVLDSGSPFTFVYKLQLKADALKIDSESLQLLFFPWTPPPCYFQWTPVTCLVYWSHVYLLCLFAFRNFKCHPWCFHAKPSADLAGYGQVWAVGRIESSCWQSQGSWETAWNICFKYFSQRGHSSQRAAVSQERGKFFYWLTCTQSTDLCYDQCQMALCGKNCLVGVSLCSSQVRSFEVCKTLMSVFFFFCWSKFVTMTYFYMCVCACACVHTHAHTHASACSTVTHMQTHTHTHTHISTHTHTYIPLPWV